ncbi:hypothetical protein B834_506 [Enterococcus mundtii 1A]|nr:hypothetical protein [Enterococcus mundtii 1A]
MRNKKNGKIESNHSSTAKVSSSEWLKSLIGTVSLAPSPGTR